MIAIPNEFCDKIKNEESGYVLYAINADSVLYYYILAYNQATNREYTRINIYYMIQDCNYARADKQLTKVREALKDLIEKGYIEIYDEHGSPIEVEKLKLKDTFLYKITQIENNYTLIEADTIQRILNNLQDSRIRSNIIKYYLLLYNRSTRTAIKDVHMIQQVTKRQAYEIAQLPPNSFMCTNELFKKLGLFYFENKFYEGNDKRITTHFIRTDQMSKEEFDNDMTKIAYVKNWHRFPQQENNNTFEPTFNF